MTTRSAASRSRRGFTLLEMLVVLVILALVARTAVVALESTVEDEWRLRTIAALDAAETAILGRPDLKQPGGQPWVEGFVADVGRLPRVRADGPLEDGRWCRELWERWEGDGIDDVDDPALPIYAVREAGGDPDVRLGVGWRGPYLRLGIGQTGWFDAYGCPFVPLDKLDNDDDLAVDGAPILGVRSKPCVGGPDLDFVDGLEMKILVGDIQRHLGTVCAVLAEAPPPGAQVLVRLYGPRDGELVTLRQELVGSDWEVEFADVPIGTRVLRAYGLQGSTPVGVNGETEIVTATKSVVIPVAVVAGGPPPIEIYLNWP